MDYDTELARIIKVLDPHANWVYNRHCEYCSKFLYPEETVACKKCNTPINNPILKPIPFTKSASAIEKLVEWLKAMAAQNPAYGLVLLNISNQMSKWLAMEDYSAKECRVSIVVYAINNLEFIS